MNVDGCEAISSRGIISRKQFEVVPSAAANVWKNAAKLHESLAIKNVKWHYEDVALSGYSTRYFEVDLMFAGYKFGGIGMQKKQARQDAAALAWNAISAGTVCLDSCVKRKQEEQHLTNETKTGEKNPISTIMEMCAKNRWTRPTFELSREYFVVDKDGHPRTVFEITCRVKAHHIGLQTEIQGIGAGRSIKSAKKLAAASTLCQFSLHSKTVSASANFNKKLQNLSVMPSEEHSNNVIELTLATTENTKTDVAMHKRMSRIAARFDKALTGVLSASAVNTADTKPRISPCVGTEFPLASADSSATKGSLKANSRSTTISTNDALRTVAFLEECQRHLIIVGRNIPLTTKANPTSQQKYFAPAADCNKDFNYYEFLSDAVMQIESRLNGDLTCASSTRLKIDTFKISVAEPIYSSVCQIFGDDSRKVPLLIAFERSSSSSREARNAACKRATRMLAICCGAADAALASSYGRLH